MIFGASLEALIVFTGMTNRLYRVITPTEDLIIGLSGIVVGAILWSLANKFKAI